VSASALRANLLAELLAVQADAICYCQRDDFIRVANSMLGTSQKTAEPNIDHSPEASVQ
jgi:hypothetical protein